MRRGHQLLARVPSLSDPRVLYDVTLYGGETWCECQAFPAWKKRGMKCWHQRVYESAERALDRCWTEHGTPDGQVCKACLLALLSAMAGKVKAHYVDKDEAKEKIKRARAAKKQPVIDVDYLAGDDVEYFTGVRWLRARVQRLTKKRVVIKVDGDPRPRSVVPKKLRRLQA